MSIKSVFWYSLGIIIFIAVVVVRNTTFLKIKEFANSVNHSREIVKTLQDISIHLKSAEIYSPQFEQADPFFYGFQAREANKLFADIRDLKRLVEADPILSLRADTIALHIMEEFPVLMHKNIVEIIKSGEGYRLSTLYKIETVISSSINYEEEQLLEQRQSLNKYIKQSNIVAIILISLSALILISAVTAHLRSYKKQKWVSVFLESVLSSSKHGILSFNHSEQRAGEKQIYAVDYANSTAHQLLGYQDGTLPGKVLSEINLFKRSDLDSRLPAIVMDGKELEEQLYFNDKWVLLFCARRDKGFTVSLYDITVLKQNEQSLKVTIGQLEVNNRQLEKYVYAASHDFQEPLRKISIFSERIKKSEQNLDDKQKAYLEKIIVASERMSDLIKDTLNYSLLQKVGEFQHVDLNQVVKEVQDDLELPILTKNATIDVALLPAVNGIAAQMRQLFFNLLSNSLKFSEPGRKPYIKITCAPLAQHDLLKYPDLSTGSNYVIIKVIDNGIGFETDYEEKIFELFTKLHNEARFKGTGIGLALCKQVVENHKGYIDAESRAGEGATFTIILPVAEKQANHQI